MQKHRRYLFLALIPLFGIGALAAGLGPLPWQIFDRATTTAPKKSKTQPQKAAGPASTAEHLVALAKQLPANSAAGGSKSASKKPATAGIDVARIDPNGASVIAGHASPSTPVTVMADGKPVGMATTDASGDFVLVTPHKFANPNAKLSVKPGDHMPGKVATTGRTRRQETTADAGPVEQKTLPRRTAAEVTRQMMRRLEKLTREAAEKPKAEAVAKKTVRKSVRQPVRRAQLPVTSSQRTASVVGTQPVRGSAQAARSGSSEGSVNDKVAAANPAARRSTELPIAPRSSVSNTATRRPALPRQAAVTPTAAPITVLNATRAPAAISVRRQRSPFALEHKRVAAVALSPPSTGQIFDARPARTVTVSEPLPVPVQFEYREDVFTDQGREAAALLLKYFKLKKFAAVTLSGHADERGTRAGNRKLSRERLRRLRTFLRDGGFTGKLTLVPKGDTEKFSGVDRSQFPLEELYQLDRRVEVVRAR